MQGPTKRLAQVLQTDRREGISESSRETISRNRNLFGAHIFNLAPNYLITVLGDFFVQAIASVPRPAARANSFGASFPVGVFDAYAVFFRIHPRSLHLQHRKLDHVVT